MNTSHRRIALLTGASLAALGIATPAFAAPHDVLLPGGDTTNSGTNTVDHTIDLCTVAAATPACFYGVIDTGVAAATATVSNTATGRIYQHDAGATISLLLTNDVQDGEVGAIAVATGAVAVPAVADANITTNAIEQFAAATAGDASVTISNSKLMLVDALAIASGDSDAAASASITTAGIQQFASVVAGAGDASANIDNIGTISVIAAASALAGANAGELANADAFIETGISQSAQNNGSGNATVMLDNSGTVNVIAAAVAVGATASADASVSSGIYQFASANNLGGDAHVTLHNAPLGTINIEATATATASVGNARADATVSTGIYQSAETFDPTGTAAVMLSNEGVINIGAHAKAVGAISADATATIDSYGIYQYAYGSSADASVDLVNKATLNIVATAFASASADASASAQVDDTAIYQSATAYNAGNVAHVGLDNQADLTIRLAATAIALNGSADATASFDDTVIEQSAQGFNGADAEATITNSGNLVVAASALAVGTNASATATFSSTVIYQYASATGGGDANVGLTNSGTLSMNANATALGTANAYAFAAFSETGIYQSAYNLGGGDAAVTLSNLDTGIIDIHAHASASATTGLASATASISSAGIHQQASQDGLGNATVVLNNAGALSIGVDAHAYGSEANALATISSAGISQSASNSGTGDASVSLTNGISLDISAVASATSTRNSASATAQMESAIYQFANADDGNATVSLVNNGTVNIEVDAHAVGNTHAYAYASIEGGILQQASATSGDALASIVNAPAMTLIANATATGNSATATATVTVGISQSANAFGGSASAVLDNSDPLTISANAVANADINDAYAFASVDTGIYQTAHATGTTGGAAADGYDASVSIINRTDAVLAITANADAVGITFASAEATVDQAMDQNATALSGAAHALLDNSGTITVLASANAAANTAASATATVDGLFQFASGATGADVVVLNSGSFEAGAVANATATGFAYASVTASGVHQTAIGGTASFTNGTAGVYNVHGTAHASGSSGSAYAEAYGLTQSAALNVFDNENAFGVIASAVASVASGAAAATATGVTGRNAFGATTASIDYVNGTAGSMNVSAIAVAPSTASAYALGIHVTQNGSTPLLALNEAILAGSIVNNGVLHVLASAAGGGTFTTVTPGGVVNTFTQSVASATGILMSSGTNNLTVTNTGLLSVDAVTAGNGTTNATGIRAAYNGAGLPAAAGSLLTITNDGGDIIVRESVDGGATWQRGMAIDVATAPNPTVINLLGDGNIYGNVDIQTGDNIFVESGTTYFDGIVNPECLPAGGLVAADLDDPLISACGQGTLTIDLDGNLILADPRLTGDPTMYDGPAYVFVDTFNVATDGTITFELQPSAGGTQPVGTYPQVFANTANLDGTLVADVTPAGGLFADNYFWDNVIDANVRNGGFDGAQCVLDGAYSGSLLLSLDCIEDANANIDLSLTRAAFDSVPGLNDNGSQVGAGLECIYDTALTGGIANLLGDLFFFTDAVNYNIALNQLSGSVYANYLQSFPSLGVHYNDLVDHATNCEIPALAGSVLECRSSAPIHVWGQLDYQWRKADGDNEAGTAKSRRFTGLMGIDANVGTAAIVGLSAGYGTNNVRDNQFGDKVDSSGMQVGAYGVYDPGAFYVKAMTTYSWFKGDANRHVNFAGLAPGATFAGNIDGDPDVNMWTFGLHGGYRMGIGGNSVLTPYLNYDYVHAKLKGFTESGLDGANLTVESGSSNHSFLTGGVKWATQLGGVVPEVNLGYRYRFGKKESDFHAAFLGDTACDFEIDSASQKRGTFLAGLSVGGKFGPVDLRIGYEGEFNSDITSHSGNFKFVLPIGGHAAPPPPPPPAPVVAPPPPVEVAPPPPPPPPPPAPVERGERGQ